MDIEVYEAIKRGLKAHFESLNLTKSYNPNVVGFEPSNPTYPILIVGESRNVPVTAFRGRLETVADLGYRVDIYAKQSGSISKQEAARVIAKHADNYMNCIGCKRISWNEISNDGENGALYHIIIMYSAYYWEQRQVILK